MAQATNPTSKHVCPDSTLKSNSRVFDPPNVNKHTEVANPLGNFVRRRHQPAGYPWSNTVREDSNNRETA
jgi:hypothetical protein